VKANSISRLGQTIRLIGSPGCLSSDPKLAARGVEFEMAPIILL
jgi:hypothetical protein